MPLPVAHSLLGATLGNGLLPLNNPNRRSILIFCGLAAIVPDLDFLPIILFDLDRSFHRGFSHAPVTAIVFGGVLLLMLGKSRWREALIYTCAILSHGILDALTAVEGQGVALLWPLTDNRYKLSASSLFEINLYSPMRTVFAKIGIELLIFGFLFWFIAWLRPTSSKRHPL